MRACVSVGASRSHSENANMPTANQPTHLGEHLPLATIESELALIGPPDLPSDADDVPAVGKLLEVSKAAIGQTFLRKLKLNCTRGILQKKESELPENATEHNPACQRIRCLGGIGFGRRQLVGKEGVEGGC